MPNRGFVFYLFLAKYSEDIPRWSTSTYRENDRLQATYSGTPPRSSCLVSAEGAHGWDTRKLHPDLRRPLFVRDGVNPIY